jgi:membrane protease YdiL (CAAX protease family)
MEKEAMPRLLFWGLFSLTLAIYATMLGWSLPIVASAAGGLVPFDMRPGGYSFADAQAFLNVLSPEGAAFYVDVQQKLDIAYPGLLALTLLFAIAALLPRRIGAWRWAAAMIALPVGVFDYLENHAVAQMIGAGATGLTPEVVAIASQWTVLKAGASTVAMSVVLALLLGRAGQWLVPWLKTIMIRRPVASFLVLALGTSALVQFMAIKAGLSMPVASSAGVVLGLALPALLVTAAEGGLTAAWALVRRSVLRPVSWQLLLVAAFGLLVAMLVVASPLQGGAPLVRLAAGWTGIFTGFLPELLFMLLAIQLCEEFAWTGFLQHRLQTRHGALKASLLVAPVFGLSHLMLNWLESGDVMPALAMVVVQIVFALFFRVMITTLANLAGGSALVAAVFHAAFNTANGDFTGALIGGNEAMWLPLALVAVSAIAAVVATRGRLGTGTSPARDALAPQPA